MKKENLLVILFPSITIPVLTVVLSAISSEVQNRVGLTSTIIGIVIIAAIIVIVGISTYLLIRNTIEKIIKNCAKDIALQAIDLYDQRVRLSNAISGRLYRLEQLLEFEAQGEMNGCKLCEVVIITSSFAYDTLDSYGLKWHFSDIVCNNIKKGIQYSYYVTRSYNTENYLHELRKSCGDKVEYHYLSDGFFFLVKDFDFVIYTVEEDNGHKKRYGYMPLSELLPSTGDTKVLYHAPISDDLINNLMTAVQNDRAHEQPAIAQNAAG